MFPPESTATSAGNSNCPSPDPREPNIASGVPAELNF
jgi:hypothetical protein